MKIFITGGAGYIGSHIALDALLVIGNSVCIYDNFENADLQVGSFLQQRGATIIAGDILDQERLLKSMREFRPDLVIHLAARKSVEESKEKPQEYYHTNVTGTLTLLQVMRDLGIGKLIFSSSASVYEPTSDSINESSELWPRSVYGTTKQRCEELITKYSGVHGLGAISFRYFNPVASHPLLLGKSSPALMGAILSTFSSGLPLKIYGDGSAVRDFIHVRDLASASLRMMPNAGEHKIFNIGTGKGTSVVELVDMMEEVTNCVIRREFVEPRSASDIQDSVADYTRFYLACGWKPPRSIREMCRDAWEAERLRLSFAY